MGSSVSFGFFYLQYPPAICGFGMLSGISHVCMFFIPKFLPEIWFIFSRRFSGRNSLFFYLLGRHIKKKQITLLRVIPTLAFQVIYSDIYFGILLNILSDIYSDILSGISSSILSGIYFGVLSGIYSGILCGILSRIYFGILCGILCGIYSGSLSGIYSGSLSGIYSGSPSGR